MIYADYAFYCDCYYGNQISEEDFPRLITKASTFIDYCTMGRAKRQRKNPAVGMACCAVAEKYQMIDLAQQAAMQSLASTAESTATSSSTAESTGELQSETVGSWSRSYRSGGSSASAALTASEQAQQQLLTAAKEYLAATGLMRARGYKA